MIIEDYHHAKIEAEYAAVKRTVTIRLRFPDWRIT
jgi:hypothetical protein